MQDITLTPLQERFVNKLLSDAITATEAYTRAGGKGKEGSSARQQAARMMAEDGVKAALQKARMERAERVKVDGDWVVQKLIENVERCMTAIPVLDRDGNETGAYSYDAAGANAALRLLGMHFGIFEKDNRQKSGQSTEEIKNRLRERGVNIDVLFPPPPPPSAN